MEYRIFNRIWNITSLCYFIQKIAQYMNNGKSHNFIRYEIVGYMIIISIFYSIIISGFLWWLNITIQPFIFPLAVFISIIHFCKRTFLYKETILFLGIIVLSLFLDCIIPDMSWDGQAYHQPMVYALANGWNPISDNHNNIINEAWNMNIWIDHYLRGMEISAATIFSMTGQLETGKAVNLLFLFSILMISMHFLMKLFPNLSHSKIILYAFFIACPMVFINYGFTFYIDVATYYLVVWILIVFILLNTSRSSLFAWYLFFIVVSLAACIKLNILFWICYCIFFYSAYLFLKKEYSRIVLIVSLSVFSILFMIVSVNYNPIITNYVDHNNPVYPLGTAYSDEISKNALPNLLKDKNRITQVAVSLLSRPNDNMETPYLYPFCISYRYNIRSLGYGAKLGGGGLFFIEILIISIIVFFLSNKLKLKCVIYTVSLLLLIALFILPYGSNYRYVPFISLLPLILLLYVEKAGLKNKFAYKLKNLCLTLLLLNNIVGILFFSRNTYVAAKSQNKAIAYLKYCKSRKSYHTKNWSFNYKLNGNHIISKEVLSDINENYVQVPNQYGPPIYIYQ